MTIRRWLALAALALVGLVPIMVGAGAVLRSGAFEPPRPAPDFALATSDGDEFRLSQARGKVIALTFGYTNCPDVCPTVLAELAQLRARLGGHAQRVEVVYVSVDPERDTATRMRAYTQLFDKTFVGLTGTRNELGPVWNAYGVAIARRDIPGGGPNAYSVHHTASVYLIDTVGRLRVMAPFGTPVDDLVHDARALLAEAAPAKDGGIQLEHAWVRRAPALPEQGGDPPKAAAYVMIVNRGSAPDALVSATADAAKSVELHETRNMSGMMMMEPVPKIVVPTGGRVELKPGGYHLMLIGLTQSLGPGQTVTLTLVFERAGPMKVRAAVK